MRLGYDAKRAFFNRSGLGNYSRDVLNMLAEYFPMNEYFLYSPQPQKPLYTLNPTNQQLIVPQKRLHQWFPFYWRSYFLYKQIENDKIDLFHGLSNEIPFHIHRTNIPSVVTIHDLIYMRYPHFYNPIDRTIYKEKCLYAATHANRIIAVSQQTANDLQEFFKIPAHKIDVVYQSCNPIFWTTADRAKRQEVLAKYLIPDHYILFVGTIEERKNVLNVLIGMRKAKIDYPLVIIGKPTRYLGTVKSYIERHEMRNIFFLHNVPNEDLPAIYQMATVFVYPSIFEGFGIPILEALVSKTPVITSKGGCFSEAGGKSTLYVDPQNPKEIGSALKEVLDNNYLRENMIFDGFVHAQKFRREKVAQQLILVYEKLV
jgi:glycosyltransferase involved in cell wall biosynthesis